MTNLPNPFESSPPKGGQEAPAAACPNEAAVGLLPDFDHDDYGAISLSEMMKRGFDVDEFMLNVEPLPRFLQAPIAVLEVLAGHM